MRDPVSTLALIFLAISTLLWFFPVRRIPWYYPFQAALALSIFSGQIQLGGIAILLGIGALLALDQRKTSSQPYKIFLRSSVVLLSFWAYHDSFQKPFVGILLLTLGFYAAQKKGYWNYILISFFRFGVPAAIGIPAFTYLLHLAQWNPQWSDLAPEWMIKNLFLICIPEEALFRGYIQRHLAIAWRGEVRGKQWAWIFASLAFGLFHWSGGIEMVALEIVAGLFYGYSYLRTNRIEVAILIHLLVNTCHVLLFS